MNNITILGDSNKKSRFNKDLADVVNKDVESRLRKEARNSKKNSNDNSQKAENISGIDLNNTASPIYDITQFVMARELFHNNGNKTLDNWVKYWNNVSSGYVMACLSNYYHMAKKSDSIGIDKFQETLKSRFLITSDRISYGFNNISDNITSHYGSKVVCPVKRDIEVPSAVDERSLEKVLSTSIGWDYLQSLFNTKDSPGEIKSVLTTLSGKNASQIKFKAFGPITRTSGINCGISLYSINDDFVIDARNNDDATGCCYSIKYDRPKVEQ